MKKPYSGDPEQTCPFRLGERCEEVCPTCEMFQCLRGTNPNTGQPVDHWQCAISMMPILMIENSQQQRATGAAVESFRNEAVRIEHERQKLESTQIKNFFQAIQRNEIDRKETTVLPFIRQE